VVPNSFIFCNAGLCSTCIYV